MKKVLSLIIMMALICSLCTACAAETTTAAGETTAAEAAAEVREDAAEHDPVTLTVWFYADNADESYDKWAAQVKEAYPWISMDFEVLPYDSGPEKFTVACATNTTPDIYFDGFSRISTAVDAGLTIDLTDVVKENSSLFYGTPTDGIKDGKNLYIPTSDGAPYCLAVNMDLAKELGVADMLPGDMETWSYDDFLALCRKAHAADAEATILPLYAATKSGDAWYYSWLLGNNVQITNDDHTATAFNTGDNQERSTQVFSFLKTLVDEGISPEGCVMLNDDECIELFQSGDVLFVATGYNMLPVINEMMEQGESVKFAMDAVALPSVEGKEASKVASWGSYGVCGFANNGHEEAARLAIDMYIKSTEARTDFLTIVGRLSTLNDVEVTYATPELTEILARAADYGTRCADSSFGIREPWWTEFRETFYVQLQDYLLGKIGVDELLNNWQSAGDTVISSATK